MSAGENSERSENLQSANSKNTDNSSSSDSGFSSSSDRSQREESRRGGAPRDKTQAKNQENIKTGSNFFNKYPRGDRDCESPQSDSSDFFQDPFFSERTSKFKKKFANRPRLSERIFGNKKGSGSVFDNDSFVDDLRKKIQEEKKMFFDGGADPFASAFGAGGARSTSPVGGSSAGRAGFPFEDLRTGARARFDEFANRHPMFSTMRNQPPWNMDDPFGHHGFPRERNNSGSSGAGSGASTASTGEERVIPIQIIRDDAPKAPPRGKSPAPPQSEPIRVAREASPQPPTAGPQRCNTEPTHPIVLEDSRTPRAQSAPPNSQNGNEKFVSKVSIDTNGSKPAATQVGGNCSKSPKAEPPTNNGGVGGGRSIPIIIEGRQAPVFNANVNGNVPGQSSTKGAPQPKVSRPADRSPTPPPKKPAPPKDPLAQVNSVFDEVRELEKLVEEFEGNSREDRDYLILDEFLTRCLIKLDVVESEGRDDVRTHRKDCIRYIQSCISKLEKKVPLPPQPDEEGDSEQTMETATVENSEVSAETEKMESGSQQLSSNQNTHLQLEPAKPTENSTPEQPSNNGEGAQKMEVDGPTSNETQVASGAGGDQQPVKA